MLEQATTVPDIVQLRPPPPAAVLAQRPAWFAVAPTQLPPQHWLSFVHASLFWRQYEVAVLQTLLMQPFEQHSVFVVQVLPEALQAFELPVAQSLFVPQTPLQQSLPVAHASPTFLHCDAEHLPSEPQKPEQHWLSLVQVVAEPVVMQGPLRLPHWSGA